MATHIPVCSTFPAVAAPLGERIPPLESGDRLSRAEFERRWEALPNLKKAELIRGVVYVQAAVSRFHSNPHFHLSIWLGNYVLVTPGVEGNTDASVRIADDSLPQPDLSLRLDQKCGGASRVDKAGIIEGPIELAIEVAASSASKDMHLKLELYRDEGVHEYIVWRVYDDELDWFMLRDGRYEPLAPGEDGILRSAVLPGLWLDKKALLSGDLTAVMRASQAGTASPEHAVFVERLRQASEGK